MNQTALYNEHVALNGKIVEFAGWMLPVMYSSIIEEHMAVRTAAGIFDISHMGEFIISGPGSVPLLKKVIPTRLDKLEPGKAMYSCLSNPSGGVIDDLFIYMVSVDRYMIVVNASNIEKDLAWLKQHAGNDVTIEDISSSTCKLDLQGPASKNVLKKIINEKKIDELPRFYFYETQFMGTTVIVSNSGYTGELGYELYIDNSRAVDLWNGLLNAGAELGLKPIGLGARDSLRIESCYSLYGHELTDDISPVEAGLSWLISSDAEYTARDILTSQKTNGTERELICLEIPDRGIPREGYRIEKNGIDTGYVTSGVFSPLMKKGIAMGLIKSGTAKMGDTLSIIIRNKPVEAVIVKRPFYVYNG